MSADTNPSSTMADLQIVDNEQVFEPGDVLRGSICVMNEYADEVRSAELSVLWYTSGKGEEDFGVHYFKRYSAVGPDSVELTRRREFRTLLPENPLSYDGIVVKVCWCARLRLFLARGRQQVVEKPFQLGNVAPARIPTLLSPDDVDE